MCPDCIVHFSANQHHHSTETAILKISNDIFEAVDARKACVLVALHLSDDHSRPFCSHQQSGNHAWPRLTGALMGLSSRTSFVKIGGERSRTTAVATGVPQGCVLKPILFSPFVSLLSNIIYKYGIQFRQYADDMQLYIAININNSAHAPTDLPTCTSDIYDWLLHNCLALNPDKSESAVWNVVKNAVSLWTETHLSNCRRGTNLPLETHQVLEWRLMRLSFDKHVDNVCQGRCFQIRTLHHVWSSMSS